jgi:hypothetical protein
MTGNCREIQHSGHPSAELIVDSMKTYGIALISPVLLDTSRQAKAKEGFTAHDFALDWDNQRAICPAGKTSVTWNPVARRVWCGSPAVRSPMSLRIWGSTGKRCGCGVRPRPTRVNAPTG